MRPLSATAPFRREIVRFLGIFWEFAGVAFTMESRVVNFGC